jgi:hypothetical protein
LQPEVCDITSFFLVISHIDVSHIATFYNKFSVNLIIPERPWQNLQLSLVNSFVEAFILMLIWHKRTDNR